MQALTHQVRGRTIWIAIFATVLVTIVTVPPAHAAKCTIPGEVGASSAAGSICVKAASLGSPGTSTSGGSNPGTSTTSGGQQTCTYAGTKIPCSGPNGVWFSSQQCYAQPATPQPPAGDPRWEGRDPAGGTVYMCLRPGVQQAWLYFYVAAGETPALVDPGELAQQVLESMTLAVPDVHLAPTPPDMTYVRLETWMWMSPDRFGTLTASATAGATSVTVVAKPVRAVWDMGDGGMQSCASPGKAWESWMSDAARTDCGYTYLTTSKGGEFVVTATIIYQADWTCSGACLRASGTLGEVPSLAGSQGIRVGERQSVVVGGNA